MNGVIVDLVDGQAAALCDDGRVVKLQDAGYSLGQIVEVHERRRRSPLWLRWASTAAAAALLLTGAGGSIAYAMPYGVVSMDVNPSLEYTINRFDYVLRVEGVNEDGKELLDQLDTSRLVHRPIGDALEASVQQLEEGDWLGGESDEILISAGTKQPAHAEKLVSILKNDLNGKREGLEVRAVTVSEADIETAHREGMSAGRHWVLGELQEREGAGFSAEEWKDKPIHDILHRLENGPADVPSHEDAHSVLPGQSPSGHEDFLPAMRGENTDSHESRVTQPSGVQSQGQQPEHPQGKKLEQPQEQQPVQLQPQQSEQSQSQQPVQPQGEAEAHASGSAQPPQVGGVGEETHTESPQDAGSIPDGGHGGTAGAPVSSTGGTPGGAGMDPGNGNPGGGAGPHR